MGGEWTLAPGRKPPSSQRLVYACSFGGCPFKLRGLVYLSPRCDRQGTHKSCDGILLGRAGEGVSER